MAAHMTTQTAEETTSETSALGKARAFARCHVLELVFLVLVAVPHLYMNFMPDYDDGFFAQILSKHQLFEWLAARYAEWSSRVVVETVLPFVASSFTLWKLLDIALCELAFCSAIALFPSKDRDAVKWPLLAAFVVYPFNDMSSAGWIATTVNYLWPLALGLYALSVLVRVARKEPAYRLTAPKAIAVALATLFASNVEQMCFVMGAVLFGLAVWQFASSRRIEPLALVMFAIVCANAAVIALCPGNAARYASEADYWWPDPNHFMDQSIVFADMGLLQKIYLGLSTTFDRYFYGTCLLGLMLMVSLCAYFLSSKTGKSVKVIACLDTVVLALFSTLSVYKNMQWDEIILKVFSQPFYDLTATRICTFALELAIFGSLAALVFFAFKDRGVSSGLLALGVLAVGFASRMAISFSPTIFASGWRTTIFFDAVLALLVAGTWKQTLEKSPKAARACLIIFAVIAAWAAQTTLRAIVSI